MTIERIMDSEGILTVKGLSSQEEIVHGWYRSHGGYHRLGIIHKLFINNLLTNLLDYVLLGTRPWR